MKTIRLLLVEEIRVIREMLQLLFNEQPDLHVVATTDESSAAVMHARELDPDVVLLGVLHRESDALQLLRAIRAVASRARIIVMDFRPTESGVAGFIREGAHGFVLRDTRIENMLHVVRLAAAGVAMAATTAAQPADGGGGGYSSEPLAGAFLLDGGAPAHLTKREEEVAGFICRGWSNKQIAGELHVSLHTVKCHVRRVLEKLELHSRVELAAFGTRHVLAHAHDRLIPQA